MPASSPGTACKPSFTIILILFKSFKAKLQKYLQLSEANHVQHFGLLRAETVDEIELEPIENSPEDEAADKVMQEGYDEMLYRQDLEYPRGGKHRGNMHQKAALLSEIGEIPDEESSIEEFAENDKNESMLTIPGGGALNATHKAKDTEISHCSVISKLSAGNAPAEAHLNTSNLVQSYPLSKKQSKKCTIEH